MNKATYKQLLMDTRWRQKRIEILERDHSTCLHCGRRSEHNDIHHISYIEGRLPWDYEDDNFIVLCRECHKKVHDFTGRCDGGDLSCLGSFYYRDWKDENHEIGVELCTVCNFYYDFKIRPDLSYESSPKRDVHFMLLRSFFSPSYQKIAVSKMWSPDKIKTFFSVLDYNRIPTPNVDSINHPLLDWYSINSEGYLENAIYPVDLWHYLKLHGLMPPIFLKIAIKNNPFVEKFEKNGCRAEKWGACTLAEIKKADDGIIIYDSRSVKNGLILNKKHYEN